MGEGVGTEQRSSFTFKTMIYSDFLTKKLSILISTMRDEWNQKIENDALLDITEATQTDLIFPSYPYPSPFNQYILASANMKEWNKPTLGCSVKLINN